MRCQLYTECVPLVELQLPVAQLRHQTTTCCGIARNQSQLIVTQWRYLQQWLVVRPFSNTRYKLAAGKQQQQYYTHSVSQIKYQTLVRLVRDCQNSFKRAVRKPVWDDMSKTQTQFIVSPAALLSKSSSFALSAINSINYLGTWWPSSLIFILFSRTAKEHTELRELYTISLAFPQLSLDSFWR